MSPRAPRDSLRRRDTHTHNKDRNGDPMRCIIICSLTTLTTVGCSTGFVSHVYRYFALGAAIRWKQQSAPMTMALVRSPGAGTSGSIIVDALLTSGTGTAHSSDIMFGSPMYWLWEIIKARCQPILRRRRHPGL